MREKEVYININIYIFNKKCPSKKNISSKKYKNQHKQRYQDFVSLCYFIREKKKETIIINTLNNMLLTKVLVTNRNNNENILMNEIIKKKMYYYHINKFQLQRASR